MKTRLLIIIGIIVILAVSITSISFLYNQEIKLVTGMMTSDEKPEPVRFEEIEGYAIDYDGDVKHLPFADICTDEMKIILLKHSNLALPEDEFVLEDVGLPFGMNQEDFKRCADETSFTKSRWNMVTMENPEKENEN